MLRYETIHRLRRRARTQDLRRLGKRDPDRLDFLQLFYGGIAAKAQSAGLMVRGDEDKGFRRMLPVKLVSQGDGAVEFPVVLDQRGDVHYMPGAVDVFVLYQKHEASAVPFLEQTDSRLGHFGERRLAALVAVEFKAQVPEPEKPQHLAALGLRQSRPVRHVGVAFFLECGDHVGIVAPSAARPADRK